MWGVAMPHEMYKFIKSFSCTPLKKTSGFEIKFTISVAGVYLFLTIVKGNTSVWDLCIAATAEGNLFATIIGLNGELFY